MTTTHNFSLATQRLKVKHTINLHIEVEEKINVNINDEEKLIDNGKKGNLTEFLNKKIENAIQEVLFDYLNYDNRFEPSGDFKIKKTSSSFSYQRIKDEEQEDEQNDY